MNIALRENFMFLLTVFLNFVGKDCKIYNIESKDIEYYIMKNKY